MTKLRLTKKAKTGILAFIASILLLILIVSIVTADEPSTTYNVSKLEQIIINDNDTLNLSVMDHIDTSSELGFNKNEVPDSLFLKSLVLDEDGQDITKDKYYVVIINSEEYDHYYGMLQSHIESTLLYEEDEAKIELYNNAILKKDVNYVYMIIAPNAKEIETTINEFKNE